MSKYKKLGKNSLLVFAGKFGSKMISFVMLPLYTKWLTVEDYGESDLITIYASFFIGLVTLSISESIFIFPKGLNYKNQKGYFSTGLGVAFGGFCVTAVLFGLCSLILKYFNISNSFSNNIWVIYLLILSTFIQDYTQQFTRAINKILVFSLSGIVLTICSVIYGFLLIPRYGVMGFIFTNILSYLMSSFYSLIHSKAYRFFSLSSFSMNKLKEMVKYSMPLIPNGIMWILVSAFNRPILEEYHGLFNVGVYAVGNKFSSLFFVIISIFMLSWQISALEEFEKKGYKEFYNRILKYIFTVLIFLSCLITILSKYVISIIVPSDYFDAWKIIPILTLSVLFSFISSFVGVNFSAVKVSKYYFFSSIYGALVSVFMNFLLVPRYGIYGAAISTLLSYFVMAISRVVFSWRYVKIENIRDYIFMILINIMLIVLFSIEIDFAFKIFFLFILALLLIVLTRFTIYNFCTYIFKKII